MIPGNVMSQLLNTPGEIFDRGDKDAALIIWPGLWDSGIWLNLDTLEPIK